MGADSHDEERAGKHSEQARALAQQVRLAVPDADERLVEAFRAVPREQFVLEAQLPFAYADRALPLVEGQTISQPTMIAIMLDALRPQPGERALEVGGGSGYAAALLARLCDHVDSVEILPELAERARENLSRARVANVTAHVGDGCRGLPSRAPFDCILVSAAAARPPPALLSQLAPGGRIAIPVDVRGGQVLQVGTRAEDASIRWRESVRCLFVPLVGS